MRKLVLMIIVGLAAFALFPSEAGAVKITQQQVNNVCGSKLQSAGGHTGCVKTCGLNKEHQCDFDCTKQGCEGTCVTCGVKVERSGFFGKIYSNRVVRQTVRTSR